MTPRADLYRVGRKHCSSCRCWRHLYEFGMATQNRNPGVLRSACSTCERIRARHRVGLKNRGKPYAQAVTYGPNKQSHCRKGHALEGDNVMIQPNGKRRCRECHRRWQSSPERREYQRMWEANRRRQQGIPERKWRSPRATPVGKNERVRVELEPFAQWLDEMAETYGDRLPYICAIHKDDIGRYRRRARARVHIDTVDRALIREGSTFLWELYPNLYEFEEVAA